MNIFPKSISAMLAIGAVGFAVNSHAAVKCAPDSATSGQAAASCAQPVAYPGYSGHQGQWQPYYYNYGYHPWGGNWAPRRGNSNNSGWDSRNRWNNRDRWDGGNRWFNRGWGDYDSYVDTFGNLKFEMDFDLDFDWDVDADADVESDADSDFDSSSNYRGRNANRLYNRSYKRNYKRNYKRYYDDYYRGYGPYNYYNYNYGYNYPYTAAPQATPTPAPLQQPAEPAEQETDFARADVISEPLSQPLNVDDDNDRVLNSSDFCPSTAAGAVVDSFGCTVEEPIVLHGVNFHTDSDRLTQESMAILDGVSATLRAHPELKLEVSGHTDSDAEDNYNRVLSQHRAERVREYLIGKGASAANLTARGYGEERPIASNESAEGKALNRRVELNRL